jgi:hypothetical protein
VALSACHIAGSSLRTWRCLGAASVVAVLCGCGAQPTDTPAVKSAGERMRSIREQCEARRLTGELESVTEVGRCADPGVIAAYREAGYPYMDFIGFAEAARLAGAQKVDSGEISEREYERQRLMLRDRLAAEINRRNAEAPSRHFLGNPRPVHHDKVDRGLERPLADSHGDALAQNGAESVPSGGTDSSGQTRLRNGPSASATVCDYQSVPLPG